jgi:hypothetical protein
MLVYESMEACISICKVIHPSLESFDPFHRALSLVNPINKTRLGVTLRGVITTTLMVT